MRPFAFCVASTLATLAIGSPDITDGGNLRALADYISADLTIYADTGIVLSNPTFEYGDSGCGLGNKKCSCTLENNSIQMHGLGSSNTWTGLNFACGFTVNNFTNPLPTRCKLNIVVPFYWENSPRVGATATWSCVSPYPKPFVSDFTIDGLNVPHVYENYWVPRVIQHMS